MKSSVISFAYFTYLQISLELIQIFANSKRHVYNFMEFCKNIHCLTSEFHDNFHAKNWYRTNHEATSAISHFLVKINVEFTCHAVNPIATWAKPNVFCFCELHLCANNTNPFKVNVNAFSCSFEWLSFRFEIWHTFIFCKFVYFQAGVEFLFSQ